MKFSKPKSKLPASVVLTKSTITTSPSLPLKLVAPSAKSVAVAGSFNGWQPTAALKLTKAGEWKGELKLPPGRYEYLFVVDGAWTPDPAAPESIPNPFGGVNSVVSVS